MCVTEEAARRICTPKLVSHSLGPQFRIAVVTSGRNFLAAPPRVEGVVSPFNVRILCHYSGIVALRSFDGEWFIAVEVFQMMKDSPYMNKILSLRQQKRLNSISYEIDFIRWIAFR